MGNNENCTKHFKQNYIKNILKIKTTLNKKLTKITNQFNNFSTTIFVF